MNVLLLGHRGMLGHVLNKVLVDNGVQVLTIDSRFSVEDKDQYFEQVKRLDFQCAINCIGLIKQKSADSLKLYAINSLFPYYLSRNLREDQKLIHISSDCVFSGSHGYYSREAEPDPTDDYGMSKHMGEIMIQSDPRVLTLRTSIIGPEFKSAYGLMSWFLSQKETVNGYTNHIWNGLTTYQLSLEILKLLQKGLNFDCSLHHLSCETTYSKFEVLKLISSQLDHRIEVIPVEHSVPINRSLKPSVPCIDLASQLEYLNDFINLTNFN